MLRPDNLGVLPVQVPQEFEAMCAEEAITYQHESIDGLLQLAMRDQLRSPTFDDEGRAILLEWYSQFHPVSAA